MSESENHDEFPTRYEFDNAVSRLTATEKDLLSRGVNVMFPPAPLVGAKGDGVTDDTAAIQSIINSGAREVVFPPNEFVLSATLTVPDYTDLKLSGASYHNVIPPHGTRLKLKSNVDMVSIGSHCSITGGIFDVREVKGFNKSCIKVDYSGDKVIQDSRIDSTIVNVGGTGCGIEFYANGEGSGFIFPFYIKGTIWGFAKGLYSHKFNNETTNWFTGLFIDASFINNVMDIDLDFGGHGGRISGSCQPLVATGKAVNATDTPLIRLNANYMVIDTMIWDIGSAINNIAIENHGKYNLLNGDLFLDPKYIKDLSVSPFNLRLMEDTKYSGTPNNESFVQRNNMNGYQDNILLGAHKKYKVAKKLTNAVVGGGGDNGLTPDGMFLDGNYASYIALVDNKRDGNVEYEITLDRARAIKYAGLKFTQRPYRVKIELYSDKVSKYVTVVDAFANDLFDKSGGIDITFAWEYNYDKDFDSFGDMSERHISKIRFTIYLSPSSSYGGKTFCTSSVAFAYDGGISFIPPHGGTLYGDLSFNSSSVGIILKDTSNGRTYRVQAVNGKLALQQIT